jgi:acyl-CoA synthetase (AMP-forming)/AMP-acid ligase II/3-hydroxymyristoyl/3-hydroxydecanoyl-(acyl carrier protein) dehydratase
MPDRMLDLYAIMARRPDDQVVGWRDRSAVRNREFLPRLLAWRELLSRQPGRNFALFHEDGIEFAAALFGAWHAGKVIWLASDALAASVAALKLSVDGFIGQFPDTCKPLHIAADAVHAIAPPAALDGAIVGLVVHTSGTTGAAQAIPKRLSQLSAEIETLDAQFAALAGTADTIATVSHQHIYGLLFKILWPLVAGRALCAQSQSFPEQLAELLAFRPSLLVTSPAHLKRLPEQLNWAAASAGLRAVFSSGGPLPAEVALASAALLGTAPIEVYGSSETGGVAWRRRESEADDAWHPFPRIEWRVTDDCDDGDDGDLLEVRSPHLFDDAWLRVADRAEALGDGRFLLKGRSDRIVKIEEKRISLDAIEALLLASPSVAAIRLALCDEGSERRQRLAAFVVLTDVGRDFLAQLGKLALNRSLTTLLDGVVEAVARPRRWRYLDQFPVDAQGKTTQALLLSLLDTRPRELEWREIERSGAHLKCEAVVVNDLYYFDGHFAGTPILPGVVQVDWAIAIARRQFDLGGKFRSIAALKFQHVIRPGATITLELTHEPQKQSVQFRYVSAAGQHASGRILFSPEA